MSRRAGCPRFRTFLRMKKCPRNGEIDNHPEVGLSRSVGIASTKVQRSGSWGEAAVRIVYPPFASIDLGQRTLRLSIWPKRTQCINASLQPEDLGAVRLAGANS